MFLELPHGARETPALPAVREGAKVYFLFNGEDGRRVAAVLEGGGSGRITQGAVRETRGSPGAPPEGLAHSAPPRSEAALRPAPPAPELPARPGPRPSAAGCL